MGGRGSCRARFQGRGGELSTKRVVSKGGVREKTGFRCGGRGAGVAGFLVRRNLKGY